MTEGASVTALDSQSRTPYELAQIMQNARIIKLLEDLFRYQKMVAQVRAHVPLEIFKSNTRLLKRQRT